MTSRTPKRAKRKAVRPCESVEFEFTQRFLSLFSSFYNTPSMDEILTFPPPPAPEFAKDPRPATKIPPFHSGVWDLRLAKTIENRRVNDAETSHTISEQVAQLREAQTVEVPDLTEILRTSKVERPEIPVYIQNLRADRQRWLDDFRKGARPPREDIFAIGFGFQERIARQRARAEQRRHQRFARAQEVERQHFDFVNSLPHHSEYQPKPPARTADRQANQEKRASLTARRS
jgi:hypothetical protein